MMRTLVHLGLSVTMLVLAACEASAPPHVVVGAPVPHVALMGTDGQKADLDSVRAGKPALVSFWATWCEACRTEFDALNRLDDRIKTEDALVIGVAVGETANVAGAFASKHQLHYAQLVDEHFALADALGQREVPATIVLDRAGNVVFSGGTLDAQALAALRKAMADKAH